MASSSKDRSLASPAESLSVEIQNVSTLASPDESSSFFSAASGAKAEGTSPSSTANNGSQSQQPPLPSPIQMQASLTQQGRQSDQRVKSPPMFPLSSPPRSQNSRNESSILLEQALFTSYTSTGSVLPDADEESLPSLSVGATQSLLMVPSPVSRPPPSLLMDESKTSRTQEQDPHQLTQQPSHKYAPPTTTFASKAGIGKSRQPPVPEVLLDNEEDTFYEDRSLGMRAQRSLVTTPRNKLDKSDTLSPSLQPSPARFSYQQDESKIDREVSYNSGNSSPFRGNSLQTLIRMKEELARANEKLKTMEQRNRIIIGERDDLERKVKDQEDISRNQVMELKLELSRLHGVSETMHSQRDDWASEKKRLEEQIRGAAREKKELMHKRLASENRQKELKLQIDRLQAQLDATNVEKTHLLEDSSRLRQENAALERAKSELEERLAKNQETQSDQFRSQVEKEKEEWLKEKVSLTHELQELGCSLADVKKQLDEEQSSRQQEKERLESELRDANESIQQANESSRQEVEKLQAEIRACNATIQHLRESRSSARSPNSSDGTRASALNNANNSMNTVRFQRETASAPSASSPLYQTQTQSFEPSAITERLARIRDSSERASMIRTHNREMARLKEEQEALVKSLEASHTEAIRRARKHADLKLETKLNELKTSLRQEYDEKLEETESSYRRQLTEVRFMANSLW